MFARLAKSTGSTPSVHGSQLVAAWKRKKGLNLAMRGSSSFSGCDQFRD